MLENYTRLNGGLQNDVFYVGEKEKVLRISDKRKTRKMVMQEIIWMNFLSDNGVTLAKPINLDVQKDCVWTYFEFIRGTEIDVTDRTQWNKKTFEEFGRILGRMHALSKEFEVDEIHRQAWSVDNPDVFGIRKGLDPWIRENYDTLMSSLFSYKITPDTFGLIHHDFHQGNLLINTEGIITVIDFDECSFNWFAQDLAVLFYHAYWQNSSFNGHEDFTQIFMGNFFDGYKTENSLHEDIISQIPIFLKQREIYLYQLFNKKWDMNNLRDWQRYTLHNLEEQIKSQEPYGDIHDFSIYL